MQIDALLSAPRAQAALRSVLPASLGAQDRAHLVVIQDWESLLDRATRGITDVAVVNPWNDLMGGIDANHLSHLMGEGRIILYLPSSQEVGARLLKDLRGAGIRNILRAGVDDDRASVERILTTASAAVLILRLKQLLRDRVPEETLALFLTVLSSWHPSQSAAGLARSLGLSEKKLRKALRASRLDPAVALRSE